MIQQATYVTYVKMYVSLVFIFKYNVVPNSYLEMEIKRYLQYVHGLQVGEKNPFSKWAFSGKNATSNYFLSITCLCFLTIADVSPLGICRKKLNHNCQVLLWTPLDQVQKYWCQYIPPRSSVVYRIFSFFFSYVQLYFTIHVKII